MKGILKNKRAEEGGSMIQLIVVIALVLLVAFAVITYFIKGNTSFLDFITGQTGKGQNPDSVISGCKSASTLESKAAYCSQTRDLKFDDKTLYKGGSCYTLKDMPKLIQAGFDTTNVVDCSGYAYARCTVELKGQWKAVCDQGEEDVATQVKDESDKPQDYNTWKTNNKCCAAAKKCTGTSTLKCTSVAATSYAACIKVGCTYVAGATTCKEDAGIDCTKIASGDCKNYPGCSLA
jgi:hypothetical protein